jgi:hypothetical protein
MFQQRPETRVYATGDGGERSNAGSNYGDWRPAGPRRPHGYDFEARFTQPSWPDADHQHYQRLRNEHARELDAHYAQWRRERYGSR